VSIASKLIRSKERLTAGGYLKIGEVARRLHISASLLRAWENAGLIEPTRTAKGYRLYSRQDLKDLKRAVYLGRARRMNSPRWSSSLAAAMARAAAPLLSCRAAAWATSSAKSAYSASWRWLTSAKLSVSPSDS